MFGGSSLAAACLFTNHAGDFNSGNTRYNTEAKASKFEGQWVWNHGHALADSIANLLCHHILLQMELV
jgi:hypothetical protein